MKRVVLLGGGYVTLHAYGALVRRLRGELRRGEVEIVVVAADTVHNFHGFTGEVVAGLLPIGLTQTPLAEAMPRARVLHARVTHVDLVARTVAFAAPDGPGELTYDALVVGTGGREPLDGVDGLTGRGLTLRGPGDLADLLQRVRVLDGPAVVVGGGLAGVELAAALAGRSAQVVLVQSADRIVPALHAEHPRLAARCTTELARLGVDVRTGVRVETVDDDSVTLSDGSVVRTHVVLATTGQRAVALPGLDSLPRDQQGRLVTTRDLLVAPDVWSAGDAASVAHPRTGVPVTANALWAIKAGDQVGRNVARALRGRAGRPFRYLGLGQAASFGVGRGVADLYGFPLTGWVAWLMRVGFFLRFMPSRSRALRVPGELARRSRTVPAPRRSRRPARRRRPTVRTARVATRRVRCASLGYGPRVTLRRTLARAYWRLSRWNLQTERVPADGAGLLIGAPHTSNWDFIFMLAISGEAELPIRWLGKHQLFKGPAGPVMRALGGIPVDRRNPAGLVEEVVARIQGGDRFYLVVTPEGTRSGSGWKSGFYRIARATDLPVTLGYVDRTTMTAGLGPTIRLTGDVGADMDVVRAFYADKSGFAPSRRTEPRLREERPGDPTPA